MPDSKIKAKLVHSNKIKEMASSTKDVPRSIIRSCSLQLDNDLATVISSDEALLAKIKRIRKFMVDYGVNPESIEKLVVPEALRYTITEAKPEEFFGKTI
jgi:hypothetical protein